MAMSILRQSDNPRFLSAGVAVVQGRIRHSARIARRIQDKINALLDAQHFFDNAGFQRVFLTYYYGSSNDLTPRFERAEHSGELLLSVTIGISDMRGKTDDEIADVFRAAALATIKTVADRFDRPSHLVVAALSGDRQLI